MPVKHPLSPSKPSDLNARIWRLSWPVMASNATVPLVALVDTAVLGHLNNVLALGAAAIANALFMFIAALFSFLRMSTTGQIAQAYGARSWPIVNRLAKQNALIGLGLSLSTMLSLPLWANEAITLLCEDQALAPLAKAYFSVRGIALPAVAIQYWLVGVLIGLQRPKISLLILISANCLNAGLDFILVYIFDLGAVAVAWASTCADYFVAVCAAIWWLKRPSDWHQALDTKAQAIEAKIRKPRQAIHLNMFIRTLLLLSVMTAFTAFGARLDTHILSANAIFMSILLLISHVLDAFAHAAEALVGERMTQQQADISLNAILRYTALWSGAAAIIIFFLLILFDTSLFKLLTNQALVGSTLEAYRHWLWCLPLIAWTSYWVDGVMVGCGQARAMRKSMQLSTLIFFGLYLILPNSNLSLWLNFYAFLLIRFLSLWPQIKQLLWAKLPNNPEATMPD
jgi:MATE family multidrug resistance protein